LVGYTIDTGESEFSEGTVTTIEPDEQDAVDPTQMQSPARRALLQDVELMPQY